MVIRIPPPPPAPLVASRRARECLHDWALVDVHQTWTGLSYLGVCTRCHAARQEWRPNRPGGATRPGASP
jgi:hypothetical protein